MALTQEHFRSAAKPPRALDMVRCKLDVLWSMLDGMYLAYVEHMPSYFNVEDEA